MKRSIIWRSVVAGAAVGSILAFTACSGGSSETASETSAPAAESSAAASEAAPASAASGEAIRVGSILDETGPINIYGVAMVAATELAIDDINKNGGVLGRPLELVTADAQSDNAKYTQYANQMIQRDEVAVLMGGITSASREAIRPVTNTADAIYFYNEQYEGGVCDRNTFFTGAVPSLQLAPLIPFAVEKFGPKVYVVAADYNFGQISSQWVNQYVKEAGGEVVGTEFIPLDVTDFSAVINNIQTAKPDFVVSILVGGNHIAFYRAYTAAGLNADTPIVSSSFGLGNEQLVLSPEESANIYVGYPYFQELDNPENKAFIDLWKSTYGDEFAYITDSAVTVWNGWHLWAAAVNKAGSLDKGAVIAALESGITFASPSGPVTMDPATGHVIQNVSIGVTNKSKGFDIVQTIEQVKPVFEQEKCDLIANPETNQQFTP